MQYDIVIIGGGLVGSSLALCLGRSGLSIAVVEAHPPEENSQPSFDSKAIALSHSSHNIFRQIDQENDGLWQRLQQYSSPIKTIHVSEKGGFGFTRLYHDEVGVDALGYVIESRDIGRELIHSIRQCKQVDYLSPYSLQDIEVHSDYVIVKLDGKKKQSLKAKLIVGADGGNSKLRALLDISNQVVDYQQTAIITTIQSQRPHAQVAFERFTPNGPLALLPLPDNRCSIVWTQKPESAHRIMHMSDEQFMQELQAVFGRRLGKIVKLGKRFAFPLKRITADKCIAHRSVLIGNAAHTLHPIAGQGFNLGLRDVSVLAQVLSEQVQKQADIGDPSALRRYQQWQSEDQQRIIRFTHGLLMLFSNRFLPLKILRNTGLVFLDNIAAIKKPFTHLAMGMAGRMSLMARGVNLYRDDRK